MNEAVILTTKEQIAFFRLMALRSAVKLEMLGMRRRGESARSIAARELGLPKTARAQTVYDALTAVIDK